MLFLTLLVHFSQSVECSALDPWLLNCTMSASQPPFVVECPSSGKYRFPCLPYDNVTCTGEKTVYREVECYPSDGKSPATALCLSVVLGFLGADRFYLGYPTIGLFKMFTGGFFGLGWYVDIFLIALRIAKPARGGAYAFEPGANFRIRLPGKVWM